MTNQEIRDRMENEARNWMEREQARIAILKEKKDRREAKEAVAKLVIGSMVVLFVLAGLLYLAAGGGK